MRGLATTLLIGTAAAAAASANDAPLPGQGAAGWSHAAWNGIAPAAWRMLPGGGLAVEGQAQGSYVWRPAAGAAQCLGWRWRVSEGPPPMDLTRRGGDRAISITVGFAGFPPDVSAGQRARHAMASTAAGGRALPRSALIYVWGGTGQEPALFASPYAHGLARVRVLRPAQAPRDAWQAERVDLAADWRAAFGGEPPPVTEIAVSTDVDDSRSRVSAAVAEIRLGPCR
jgi:hypothetical protein